MSVVSVHPEESVTAWLDQLKVGQISQASQLW